MFTDTETQKQLNKGLYQQLCALANKVGYSWVYIMVVAALSLIASVWAAELIVYTIFIVAAVLICLLCRDLLPIAPLVVFSYIAPSVANNPGKNPESIFYPENGGIYLLVLAAILLVVLVARLCLDQEIGFRKIFREKYSLRLGIFALGGAYLLSGIGVEGYSEMAAKNIFFAFLQFVSIALLYFVFAGSVKWEKAPRWYFPSIGVAVGYVLLLQLVNVYITRGVIVDGVIQRVKIYTGWGMYNNVGGMLIMMLPFPFYFACRQKTGWLGVLTAMIFLLGVGMTSSRGSILTGSLVCILGCAVTMVYARNKRETFWVIAVTFCLVTVALGLCWETVSKLLQVILEKKLETSRNDIYAEGLQQFAKYPIFGGGFYPIDFVPWDFSVVGEFSDFFPPRWHNTVVQLLACCGVVGLGAYIFHCVQVAKVMFYNTSRLKAIIALSVVALMVSSMLDCHFFNIGPVLFYSMALAVAEKTEGTE